MASLIDDLNDLINPAPKEVVDETDDVDDTSARVVDKFDEYAKDDDDIIDSRSFGRRKTREQFLDEENVRYKGSVVNRSEFFEVDDNAEGDDDSEEGFSDDSEPDVVVLPSEEDDDEESESRDHDDENDFKKSKEKEKKLRFSEKSSAQFDDTESTELVAPFSQVDIDDEMAKAHAVQRQLKLWEQLLSARIRLQRILSMVNQLPQDNDSWVSFSSPNETGHLDDTRNQLKHILDNLLNFQTQEFTRNSTTKYLVEKPVSSDKVATNNIDSDEEILSSPDEDHDNEETKSSEKLKKFSKQSHKISEYPSFLARRNDNFKDYRDKVLLHWYEKTRLASGKIGGKNDFTGFEKNVLKQIEQILSDKNRLLKRTQLKRSSYTVLGKHKLDDANDTNEEYDAEIFDDDDFYHHLLRELIERKSVATTDPYALSRQWLEIQKLRSKAKKKSVDRKASKGRKIRYDVFPKLANFMAPIDRHRFVDDSKDELFDSLFGKSAIEETTTVHENFKLI